MVLKKENYIFTTVTTWGWTDETLMAAILGFLPDDKETHMINGSESRILWSKTKLSNDTYYSVIDASVRLHKLCDELDFTVTNYGDIIIYRTTNCSFTPQEVLESYNRYISSRFFIREEKKEDKEMGTTLHEGEYILISKKITEEACCFGYALLSIIGINTSKVNYIGPTKNFLTFAVIKDLELPFSINEWQDFEVKDVKFHAYTKNFKNLILLEHDEFSLDYVDELDEFFVNKKKENNEMIIKQNNYIYIASNTTGSSDSQLIEALFGYVPTCTKYEMIHQYVCNELWSRTKFLHERSFDSIDAHRRLKELDEKLSFVMTEKGDVIIYRDIISDKSKIFSAYYEYSKNDDMGKFNCVKSNSGRYDPLRLTTDTQTILTMPRNLGRTAAMSMLNSIYGLNGGLRWDLWDTHFKLYFGVERATGKQKTVCLWKDGEKTIIRGDKSVLSMPVQYAVAWCYVKRRFKTTSQFKKYVDDHSFTLDSITYFEGDARANKAQASANNRTKKYDIYDAAALAITAKHYGSVKTIMAYCDGWGE